MSCDNGTGSPRAEDKTSSPCPQHRLPTCLFLGSHEEQNGELTLDASTLKEVWKDEPVAVALASMLKAVLEGRVSSSKADDGANDNKSDKKDDSSEEGGSSQSEEEEQDLKKEEKKDEEGEEEEEPKDNTLQAKLALVEVFECFSAGMAPGNKPIHILDIDSLLVRQRELAEARKAKSSNKDEQEASSDDAESSTKDTVVDLEKITPEEEMLSVLLNLVYAIRRKHKSSSPLERSPGEGESTSDDQSLTFGIVDSDLPSCEKNDFDKEWLLVYRETKKHKSAENGIYPIQSIYSFFLVLNSEDFSQPSSQSPSSDGSDGVDDDSNGSGGSSDNNNDDDDETQGTEEEEGETVSVTPESEESKGTPDKSASSPQDLSKSSLFVSVKKHEESAWSVLAALHEEGLEIKEDDDESSAGNSRSQVPDVTVIVDPLRIISEYIRYLQGEDAPPRDDQRKRRRVHVHESTVARPSCKIRILTAIDENEEGQSISPSAATHQNKEEYLQAKMVREQDELRKLLEQKLRELQQSIEQASQEEEEEQAREKSSSSSSSSSSVDLPESRNSASIPQ